MSKFLPIGSIIAYAGPLNTFPEYDKVYTKGWLLCSGSYLLSNGVMTEPLFDVIQEKWGFTIVNSRKWYRVPDLRGEFLRGIPPQYDAGANTDKYAKYEGGAKDGIGCYQKSDVGKHVHRISTRCADTQNTVANKLPYRDGGKAGDWMSEENDGDETRPNNAFVNYLIKWWEYDVRDDSLVPDSVEEFLEKYSLKE